MAKARRLTEKGVQRIAPGAKRVEVPDTIVSGLRLIVQPTGHKSWALRYRLYGRVAKFTVGPWPEFTLSDAREEGRKALKQIARGKHPLAVRREAESNTVESVIANWLAKDQAGNKSLHEVRRTVYHDVVPRWGKRPITSITRRDVIDLLDKIVERGAAVHARRVYAYVHRLLRWATMRGIIEVNPAADLPKPGGTERPRERMLNDSELARVWRASERLDYPFGPAFQLLILTAARRSEILSLRWNEVDLAAGVIRLGGERTKNGKPHTIPLSKPARTILEALPHVGRDSDGFVFTTTGSTRASGVSRAKAMLDKLACEIDAGGNRLDEPESIPAWRLHDLRRTAATGMQRLGCRLEVIESALGHLGGSRAGIVGVYQRHSFEDEKRRALDAWARHVTALAARCEAAKVLPLRTA